MDTLSPLKNILLSVVGLVATWIAIDHGAVLTLAATVAVTIVLTYFCVNHLMRRHRKELNRTVELAIKDHYDRHHAKTGDPLTGG